MNLTDCDDAFMKRESSSSSQVIYQELIQAPEDNSFYNSSVPEMLPPPPHPPPSPPLLLIARTKQPPPTLLTAKPPPTASASAPASTPLEVNCGRTSTHSLCQQPAAAASTCRFVQIATAQPPLTTFVSNLNQHLHLSYTTAIQTSTCNLCQPPEDTSST
ncbi:hypothetical protein NQZ68_025179 [Dissostichus eleginoides]|nr:hypothetical protein NQZ68_025179 [Dissostichus eleginoides]